jgi:hypothetical protein
MADVEMKEAAGSSKGKAVAKTDSAGDKKKFEIKKVRHEHIELHLTILTGDTSGTLLPYGHGTLS